MPRRADPVLPLAWRRAPRFAGELDANMVLLPPHDFHIADGVIAVDEKLEGIGRGSDVGASNLGSDRRNVSYLAADNQAIVHRDNLANFEHARPAYGSFVFIFHATLPPKGSANR